MNSKLERIEALEAEIKKLKQELSEPEFEVGWYWANEKAKAEQTYLAYYENTNSNEAYGFGWAGFWSDRLHTTFNEYKIKATESEVFEALKKEAIKRGFKEGVKFRCLNSGKIREYKSFTKHNHNTGFVTNLIFDDNGLYCYDGLWSEDINGDAVCSNPHIFKDGKWAEIIDEPFKVCGYEVKKDEYNLIKIGCKKINGTGIKDIKQFMEVHNFKSVQFDEYKVTLEEINKILEL